MDASRTELLVRLVSTHQEALFRYVFALLPHEEDARDVLQETCVALYRKFGDYDSTKPFLPWAHRFAFLEVLKHRERSQRGNHVLASDLVERLARERAQEEPVLEARLVLPHS
jgi:RNA polymerase sigma-70 factor, ECF subfamily